MHHISPKQYAEKVLRLSHHMCKMTQQQNWQQCMQLEEERQQTINALFEHVEMPAALTEITDILEQVLLIDNESIVLCQEARSKACQDIKAIQQGRKVVNYYYNNN